MTNLENHIIDTDNHILQLELDLRDKEVKKNNIKINYEDTLYTTTNESNYILKSINELKDINNDLIITNKQVKNEINNKKDK
jgi:hypothetical protein